MMSSWFGLWTVDLNGIKFNHLDGTLDINMEHKHGGKNNKSERLNDGNSTGLVPC